MMTTWTLVCPAEDASSARPISAEMVEDYQKSAKALGLRCTRDEARRKLYLGLPAPVGKGTPVKPAVPPYFSQRDSQVVIQGENQANRICFSVCISMILKDLKPNALSGSSNADDEYVRRVFEFGDTTDAAVQLRALAHFGLKGRFTTSMSLEELDDLLDAGKRVATGLLHHGTNLAPTGGGHYILPYAREKGGYRVHDPYGEMDLVRGGYISTNGRSLLYSRENFARRWCVENPHSGYALWVP